MPFGLCGAQCIVGAAWALAAVMLVAPAVPNPFAKKQDDEDVEAEP